MIFSDFLKTIVFVKLLVLLSVTYAQSKENNSSNSTVITSIPTNKTSVKNDTETTVVLTEVGKVRVQENANEKTPERMGREHVLVESKKINNETPTVSVNNNNNKTTIEKPTSLLNDTRTIPVYEKSDDNTKTKPRKGVTFDDFQKKPSSTTLPTILNKTVVNANTTATTTIKVSTVNVTVMKVTQKPKKPTVTVGGDDEALAGKVEVSEVKDAGNVPSLDFITENKKHSTDYIVPIVAVILSVPLVAIFISVLYKRASEWWQHRHYRRMDFLIEGMYNN